MPNDSGCKRASAYLGRCRRCLWPSSLPDRPASASSARALVPKLSIRSPVAEQNMKEVQSGNAESVRLRDENVTYGDGQLLASAFRRLVGDFGIRYSGCVSKFIGDLPRDLLLVDVRLLNLMKQSKRYETSKTEWFRWTADVPCNKPSGREFDWFLPCLVS